MSNIIDVTIEKIETQYGYYLLTFKIGKENFDIQMAECDFEKLDEKIIEKAVKEKIIELYKESEVEKFRKSLLKKKYEFDLKSLMVVDRL